MDNDVLYVSIHIAKTAGSALFDVLLKVFGERLQRAYRPPGDGVRSKQHGWPEIENPACIHCHVVLERFGHVLQKRKNKKWIIFVREPLSMNISLYYHHINHNPGHRFNGKKITEVALEDFLLARGGKVFAGTVEKFGKSIEEFDFVGVTEMFPESIFLMFKDFGWVPVEFGFDNTGKYKKPEFDTSFLEKFKQRHAEDYRIYDWAVNNLRGKASRYTGDFEMDLREFKHKYMRSA
jgi:hypothetical protein